jgi:hypothetical protein
MKVIFEFDNPEAAAAVLNTILARKVEPELQVELAAEPIEPEPIEPTHNPFAVPTAAAPSTAVVGTPVTAPEASPPAVPAPPTAVTPPAPPIAPAAAAPVAPAAPTSPAAIELDKAGLPWDQRIHSSTKAKVKDGTWRQKRDLDPALKKQVEAELIGALKAPAAAAPPVAPVAPVVPAPPVAPETVAAALPPAAPPTEETFATLMARLAPHFTSDPAFTAKIGTALGQLQLTALGQLALRPDLVGEFARLIDAEIAK